ncbi:melanoma-associated antigen 8 [Tupaia chinensis]|uniref:Melanoma-associated antigen 8 n=1 Tax=Tupaia chinensis TaxID=246437 RepID=L8XZY9_TUPCH|nr:melanoma-associated antigen 8 [Tupaia chinensis]ELV09618.1 Melanoma-associated antigen 8 [Tupaia chinensis]
MPHTEEPQFSVPDAGLQAQKEAPGLVGAQVTEAEVEEAAVTASPLCSSVTLGAPEEAPDTPSLPSTCLTTRAMAVAPQSQSAGGSSSEEEQEPHTLQDPAGPVSSLGEALDEKMVELVHFLLDKYRRKELTTEAEMQNSVVQNHQDHFPLIFSKASECLHLLFGIDMKEVDASDRSYVLVTTLGLTYDGMVDEDESVPKTGLLVIVLGLILLEDDHAPEKEIWEALNVMGVYAGREHHRYGEPRKLLTEEWVQEDYLEYRRVPGSDPACYEFSWGPRAHAETSQIKVLDNLLKVHGSDRRSFPSEYDEALGDEEGGAQAGAAPRVSGGAGAQGTFQDPI